MEGEKLKQELLRLLRSDWEFRRAVAAELGLLEILERMDRLEERMARLEERMLRVEERLEEHARAIRALQEQVARLQEQVVKLQEQVAEHTRAIRVLQEQVAKLQEQVAKLQEQVVENTRAIKAMQEQMVKLQEQVAENTKAIRALQEQVAEHTRIIRGLQEDVRKLYTLVEDNRKKLNYLEFVVSSLAESMYCKFVLDSIREECLSRGERVEAWMRNVNVKGTEVDMLIVTERRVYIVEVKIRPRIDDVGALLAKADAVSSAYPGREVIPVLTGTRVPLEVVEYASRKGVRVYAW